MMWHVESNYYSTWQVVVLAGGFGETKDISEYLNWSTSFIHHASQNRRAQPADSCLWL